MTYLNKFFGNLLLDEENALDNREMQIWEGKSKEKSKEKILKSKEKILSSQKILELIKQNPSIPTTEMAENLKISRRAIAKQIANLKENNQIRRVGPDKGGHWEVIEK